MAILATGVARVPAAGDAGGRPTRGRLEAFLGLFTEVHDGEGLTALLLMFNVFLLLSGYYLLKTIREPLVLAAKGGGAEVKSYASAAIAALLLVLVPAYGAIASRLSRVKLVNGVTAFFIACLVGFMVWAQAVGVAGSAPAGGDDAASTGQLALGITFFVWVGIFNLMVVAQFWGFANDLYTVEEGKRLFAIVAFGGALGAIVGAFVADPLTRALGIPPLMAIAAGLLGVCMALTNVIHVREKRRMVGRRTRTPEGNAEEPDGAIVGRSGFSLVFTDRYLLLIALLLLVLNLVNTTGEYILGETLTHLAKDRVAQGQMAQADVGKWIAGFYSGYFTWVNVISAVVQALVVSRVVKLAGVRGALLVLPVVAFGAYAMLVFAPALGLIRGAKIAENSLDYSLNNTARQALFLPTGRDAKYKAKQAIDTFFVRSGDLLSAALVFVGTTWLALAPRHFAMVNVALVLVWLAIAAAAGRTFQERSGER
jgi:ATP:ADP antiporter, AAA family